MKSILSRRWFFCVSLQILQLQQHLDQKINLEKLRHFYYHVHSVTIKKIIATYLLLRSNLSIWRHHWKTNHKIAVINYQKKRFTNNCLTITPDFIHYQKKKQMHLPKQHRGGFRHAEHLQTNHQRRKQFNHRPLNPQTKQPNNVLTFHPKFSKNVHKRAWPVVLPPHGPATTKNKT